MPDTGGVSCSVFAHSLDDRVRYHPYVVSSREETTSLPYRIVGRSVTEMQPMGPVIVGYYLQPWRRTGVWMKDRPFFVMAEQVMPWEQEKEGDNA